MRHTRSLRTLVFLVAALLVAGCAAESARYSVGVEVSNAPPPPRVVWVSRPSYELEFRGVYVVNADAYNADCDIFRYSGSWYAYTGGFWYRASSYQGPYVAVAVERVPRAIFEVPADHWKKGHPLGGPPGQMKKHRRGRMDD